MEPLEHLPEEELKPVTFLRQVELTEKNDRFSIRLDVYWENVLESPIGLPIVVSKALESVGIEPYIRKFKATEQEKELPLGDFERSQVGYIVIVNTEGTKLLQTPTEEEAEDISKRVVLINGFEIYPEGMPFLGQPSLSSSLTVRCLHGTAVLQVCIFPR